MDLPTLNRKRANILLVDDQEESLMILESILEDLGQNLIKVRSGEEALKCLLENEISLILLDVRLPGMDGFETAAMVREREKSRHIPIIFLTGADDEEEQVFKAYSLGAVDYILKPFSPEVLRSKTAVFVDLFKKTEEVQRQAEMLALANEELKREAGARRLIEEERNRLMREILDAGERERRQIGQDLHDDLCQQLTAIAFLTKALEKKLAAQSIPQAGDIAKISMLLDQAISCARHMAKGLTPGELEASGLLSALQILASNVEMTTGVACAVSTDLTFTVDDITVGSQLYRIVQEAINNAVKHGRAKNVRIRLVKRDRALIMSVEDDGLGIPDVLPASQGMGLKSMRYRAGVIGASIDIQRNGKGGTTLTCSLPYEGVRRPAGAEALN